MKAVHTVTASPNTLKDRIQELSYPYYSVLAITAWCLRFTTRLQHGRPTPDLRTRKLTGQDITTARNWILLQNQAGNFPKERRALERGLAIPPTSRLKALNPVLDSSRLLRVGGRLGNSALSLSQQHPITADSRDAIIIKWFEHVHLSLCHCGPSLLLSYTGTHLHILGARKLEQTNLLPVQDLQKIGSQMDYTADGRTPSTEGHSSHGLHTHWHGLCRSFLYQDGTCQKASGVAVIPLHLRVPYL